MLREIIWYPVQSGWAVTIWQGANTSAQAHEDEGECSEGKGYGTLEASMTRVAEGQLQHYAAWLSVIWGLAQEQGP